MALSTNRHPQLRTNAGAPRYGCDIFKASINGVVISGWFIPLQGGVSVTYSNEISKYKRDGFTTIVDYDDPMISLTLSCIYSVGISPGRAVTATGGFSNPAGTTYYDPHGTSIPAGAVRNTPTQTPTRSSSETNAIDVGVPNWAFGIGDVWRFSVDTAMSDRGPASPPTDFTVHDLLLEPGTSWTQPANGFWQLRLNFVTLLYSAAMFGGKAGGYLSPQVPSSDPPVLPTTPGGN